MKKSASLASVLFLAFTVSALAYSSTPTAPITIYTTDNIGLHSTPGIENFTEYACAFSYPGNVYDGTVGVENVFHFSGNYPNLPAGQWRIKYSGVPCSYNTVLFYDYVSGIYTVTTPPPPPPPVLRVQMQDQITSSLVDYGTNALAILGIFLGIGVAYLIFLFGYRKIRNLFYGYDRELYQENDDYARFIDKK